jgi:hypothetical protein
MTLEPSAIQVAGCGALPIPACLFLSWACSRLLALVDLRTSTETQFNPGPSTESNPQPTTPVITAAPETVPLPPSSCPHRNRYPTSHREPPAFPGFQRYGVSTRTISIGCGWQMA